MAAHKKAPLQDEETRREMLRHLRYVDEVIFEFLWDITLKLCEKYKIDFVAHDATPYDCKGVGADGDLYGWAKRAGMFLETKRTEGVSSTILRRMICK